MLPMEGHVSVAEGHVSVAEGHVSVAEGHVSVAEGHQSMIARLDPDPFFFLQLVDEIDIRKCFMDVDKKFKGHHGIILSRQQWEKLKRAVGFIDRKIAVMTKRMNAG